VNRGGIRWVSQKLSKADSSVKVGEGAAPISRILIVDRDSMTSDLLASALVSNGSCQASAIGSKDLLQGLSSGLVGLVVIGAELNCNNGSGFDLAHTVGRAYPQIRIVMLLNNSTSESVISAFRAGARGVFSRERPVAEFLDCVEHVRKGFIWAGLRETNALLEAFKSIPAPNPVTASKAATLTVRELQVVQCAAKGKTNKAIASELRLSEHTVKNYLFRAFEKLGVTSRVELLFYLTIRGHTFGASVGDGESTAKPG
jgi:two-component system, NarL family, nitrate/nitrite response regulator NarL